MTWWLWIVAGLGLFVLEMLTPGGFFLVFFGCAALIVAILDKLDVVSDPKVEWLLFGILGTTLLVSLRSSIKRKFESAAPVVDSLPGEVGTASEDLEAGARGKFQLRGTTWTAFNVGTAKIAKGGRARVLKIEGLELKVEAE